MAQNNASSSQIVDDEFGLIKINRVRGGSRVSLRQNQLGQLKITAPSWLSQRQIVRFINEQRLAVRELITKQAKKKYVNGQAIGKNHLLKIEPSDQLGITIRPNFLIVKLPAGHQLDEPEVQALISQGVVKILRQQSRHYLPERLAYLAKKYGFRYQKLSLPHALTRWGSCTSARGHISLNIVLMTLPNEAIDYVIIHELCHLRHPDHSKAFWREVEQIMPNYKYYKKLLKNYSVVV